MNALRSHALFCSAYLNALGGTLVNVVQRAPDGVLVFFPSYGVMQKTVEAWKEPYGDAKATVWDNIAKHKQVVLEPKQSDQFALAMEDFRRKLADPETRGALFFAVCRGKVSEGLDFADKNGRAVIVTGLPYPNIKVCLSSICNLLCAS